MTRKRGDSYRAYAASMPMFIPGSPGARLWRLLFRGRRPTAGLLTLAFAATLAAALGAAAGLRAYSQGHLTEIVRAGVLGVSLTGGDRETLRRRLDGALADPEVRDRISEHPSDHALVAYVLPQDYMMQHLIADLGEHEAHHGGADDPGIVAALKDLADMYTLKPLRQLRAGAVSSSQRVIFTMAQTASTQSVSVQRDLAADVLRMPLSFVDLEGGRAVMTMDTPPRHTWGTIPVPAF